MTFNPFEGAWKSIKEAPPIVTMDRVKEEKEEQPDVIKREFNLHALPNLHPSS